MTSMVRKEDLSSGPWIRFHRFSLKVPNGFTLTSPESNQVHWSLKFRLFFEHSSAQLSGNIGFPAIGGNFVLMRISVYYIPWTRHAQDFMCRNISQYSFWSCSAAESSSSSETSQVFFDVSNQRSLASTASRTTLPVVCVSNLCSTILIKRIYSFSGGRFAFKKDTQWLPESNLD